MKKIYVFVLRSYFGPLLLTFFISLFILDMQFLWKWVDELVGKGLEGGMIAELLFYATATFVPLALPLAILLSSLMTFGNLGEHYELVAMKAAGISLRTIMKPLVILSIFISAFAFYFSNNVLPVATLKFSNLLYDIRQQKLAFNIKEGVFYNGLEGYTIRIGKKDSDGIKIYDVMIYDHTKRMGNVDVTIAKSGRMELANAGRYIVFTLYDGYKYSEVMNVSGYRKSRPFERTKFKEQIVKFDLQDFEMTRTDESLFKDHYRMLNISQLSYAIDSLNSNLTERKDKFKLEHSRNYHFYNRLDSNFAMNVDSSKMLRESILERFEQDDQEKIVDAAFANARNVKNNLGWQKDDFDSRSTRIIKHKVVWHKKLTLSIACLILFFIGAPLGAIIRKGGLGLPVVISVVFFIIFHIASITGEKYVIAGGLTPTVGMWAASVILLPIGIFLTYKATTDSPLLDADGWRKTFNYILRIRKKNESINDMQ